MNQSSKIKQLVFDEKGKTKKISDVIDMVSVRLVKDMDYISERPLRNSDDVIQFLGEQLCNYNREVVAMINMSSAGNVINASILTMGTVNEALMPVAEAYKVALLSNASQMILLHNHPSGEVSPSKADVSVTRRFALAGHLVGVPLVDHVIVGRSSKYGLQKYSFRMNRPECIQVDEKWQEPESQKTAGRDEGTRKENRSFLQKRGVAI